MRKLKLYLAVLLVMLFQANHLLGVPTRKTSKKKSAPAKTSLVKASYTKTSTRTRQTVPARSATAKSVKPTAKKVSKKSAAKSAAKPGKSGGVAGGPWKEPTFADSTLGDVIDGEDLIIRRAAVDALGPYNGSIVVTDPQSGRILTIVNQKLALGSGFQPCSTVKIVTALAGLKEGLIDREKMLRLGRKSSMNLTEALAHSSNSYFARVGTDLGFEKVHEYAQLLGLGEPAGLNIPGEYPGTLTSEPPKFGGVGMMTSFGEGIQLTPLQLSAMLSAVANGGTLYHLQYPRTKEEIEGFTPKVKRHLQFQDEIPDLRPGMMAAVEYGTARRAQYDPNEPILGKTGTCTDRATPTHLGWFGSFNEVGRNKLTVVVLLTGGKPVNGSVAAEVAGSVYRNLSQQQFFAETGRRSLNASAHDDDED